MILDRGLSLLPWGCCCVLENPTFHNETPFMPTTPPSLLPALEHVRNKGNKADSQRKWRKYRPGPTQIGKPPRKVGGIRRWWKRRNLKESPGVQQSSTKIGTWTKLCTFELIMETEMFCWKKDLRTSLVFCYSSRFQPWLFLSIVIHLFFECWYSLRF